MDARSIVVAQQSLPQTISGYLIAANHAACFGKRYAPHISRKKDEGIRVHH